MRRVFILSSASVLALTGLAKIWSAFGTAKVLNLPDPIFTIEFRHLILVTGVIELVLASFCVLRKREAWALFFLAWLNTGFLAYRLGLHWVRWNQPCPCLGSLTGALHLDQHLADNLMKGVLAYMLVGSYALLIWLWKEKRMARMKTPYFAETAKSVS